MGLTEDFNEFKTTVNAGLDTIGTELTEIQADIERIKAQSTETPAEVLEAMNALKARVASLAQVASQISDVDNPVQTEPVEPL